MYFELLNAARHSVLLDRGDAHNKRSFGGRDKGAWTFPDTLVSDAPLDELSENGLEAHGLEASSLNEDEVLEKRHKLFSNQSRSGCVGLHVADPGRGLTFVTSFIRSGLFCTRT